ncbi:hypothetical protein EES37_20500 [Streptomyces sp. ADI91-18]|nr:hypothetical protein EES37_20500 [Streptomyces sp. ADI91-18]
MEPARADGRPRPGRVRPVLLRRRCLRWCRSGQLRRRQYVPGRPRGPPPGPGPGSDVPRLGPVGRGGRHGGHPENRRRLAHGPRRCDRPDRHRRRGPVRQRVRLRAGPAGAGQAGPGRAARRHTRRNAPAPALRPRPHALASCGPGRHGRRRCLRAPARRAAAGPAAGSGHGVGPGPGGRGTRLRGPRSGGPGAVVRRGRLRFADRGGAAQPPRGGDGCAPARHPRLRLPESGGPGGVPARRTARRPWSGRGRGRGPRIRRRADRHRGDGLPLPR